MRSLWCSRAQTHSTRTRTYSRKTALRSSNMVQHSLAAVAGADVPMAIFPLRAAIHGTAPSTSHKSRAGARTFEALPFGRTRAGSLVADHHVAPPAHRDEGPALSRGRRARAVWRSTPRVLSAGLRIDAALSALTVAGCHGGAVGREGRRPLRSGSRRGGGGCGGWSEEVLAAAPVVDSRQRGLDAKRILVDPAPTPHFTLVVSRHKSASFVHSFSESL
eukprot:COSAG04_NODE_1227_length_7681_cov_5.724083_4_plen_219_part_00